MPLTIAGYDREKGTVTIIFQKVGLTTKLLGALNEGDYIQDFVGPLGKPTNIEGVKRVCVVGGGVGCAIALPVRQGASRRPAVEVDVIVGFRNKDIVILEDEFRACCRQPVPHDRRRLLRRARLRHRKAPSSCWKPATSTTRSSPSAPSP